MCDKCVEDFCLLPTEDDVRRLQRWFGLFGAEVTDDDSSIETF